MSIKKRKYSLFTNAFDNKFIEAVKHITNFKNANYVKNKPTVYAVASRREHVWEHFPDLNLTELNKLYPKDSIGIRIYYGQNGTERMNYLVFTKENSKSKKGIANDIVSKIYLVDGEFKIYPLPIEVHPTIHNNHHSCEPDCPDTSILGFF